MDINININLLGSEKKLRSKSQPMIDGENESEKQLRSKKNVMIDGDSNIEGETYIDANGNITSKPKAKMIDLAKSYKPEKVVERETGVK